jgi:hypothetical protein
VTYIGQAVAVQAVVVHVDDLEGEVGHGDDELGRGDHVGRGPGDGAAHKAVAGVLRAVVHARHHAEVVVDAQAVLVAAEVGEDAVLRLGGDGGTEDGEAGGPRKRPDSHNGRLYDGKRAEARAREGWDNRGRERQTHVHPGVDNAVLLRARELSLAVVKAQTVEARGHGGEGVEGLVGLRAETAAVAHREESLRGGKGNIRERKDTKQSMRERERKREKERERKRET